MPVDFTDVPVKMQVMEIPPLPADCGYSDGKVRIPRPWLVRHGKPGTVDRFFRLPWWAFCVVIHGHGNLTRIDIPSYPGNIVIISPCYDRLRALYEAIERETACGSGKTVHRDTSVISWQRTCSE